MTLVMTPVTAPPEAGPGQLPGRRTRPWWRRILSSEAPPAVVQATLERLLALLEAARGELAAGWVCGAWQTAPAAGGEQVVLTGLEAGLSGRDPASAVCLVAALVRAGARQGSDAETGRAIDVVYDAVWESRGQPAVTPKAAPVPVSSPQVRQAKVQALTRWNDAPERTGSEVVAVLDGAIARVMQDLAARPALPVPARAPG